MTVTVCASTSNDSGQEGNTQGWGILNNNILIVFTF